MNVKEIERRLVGFDCIELRGKWVDVRLEVRIWVRLYRMRSSDFILNVVDVVDGF